MTGLGSARNTPRLSFLAPSHSTPAGQSLLIIGPSGCGKSSLLRALAGLWSEGSGTAVLPPHRHTFFLPQAGPSSIRQPPLHTYLVELLPPLLYRPSTPHSFPYSLKVHSPSPLQKPFMAVKLRLTPLPLLTQTLPHVVPLHCRNPSWPSNSAPPPPLPCRPPPLQKPFMAIGSLRRQLMFPSGEGGGGLEGGAGGAGGQKGEGRGRTGRGGEQAGQITGVAVSFLVPMSVTLVSHLPLMQVFMLPPPGSRGAAVQTVPSLMARGGPRPRCSRLVQTVPSSGGLGARGRGGTAGSTAAGTALLLHSTTASAADMWRYRTMLRCCPCCRNRRPKAQQSGKAETRC